MFFATDYSDETDKSQQPALYCHSESSEGPSMNFASEYGFGFFASLRMTSMVYLCPTVPSVADF